MSVQVADYALRVIRIPADRFLFELNAHLYGDRGARRLLQESVSVGIDEEHWLETDQHVTCWRLPALAQSGAERSPYRSIRGRGRSDHPA